MLHIKFRDHPYRGTAVEILPQSEEQILELRNLLTQNFLIENPVITFSSIHKSGGFDNLTKEEIETKAQKTEYLSKAWDDNVAVANILQVLTRLMDLYMEARRELDSIFDD